MTSDFKLTTTRESDVEDAVIAWAENHGWLHRFMSYRGRRGCPDSFFFGYGKIVMMEFKKPDGVVSANQIKEHERLADKGLYVYVVCDRDYGTRILKSYMDN